MADSGHFVNLTETGGLTRAGQHYQTDSQEGESHSRNFQSRMQEAQGGMRGRAGLQFLGMTATHSENLKALGAHFAEQAVRAVRGEQAIVTGEDDAVTGQAHTASHVEGQATAFRRPINT